MPIKALYNIENNNFNDIIYLSFFLLISVKGGEGVEKFIFLLVVVIMFILLSKNAY